MYGAEACSFQFAAAAATSASRPRFRASCAAPACDAARLFRVNDGYPIIAKLAAVERGDAGRKSASAGSRTSARIGPKPIRTRFSRGATRRWHNRIPGQEMRPGKGLAWFHVETVSGLSLTQLARGAVLALLDAPARGAALAFHAPQASSSRRGPLQRPEHNHRTGRCRRPL